MIIDLPSVSDIPALRALWKEAFGDADEFLDTFMNTAFSPCRAMCAKDGEKISAMLYWFDCECRGERVAYLYAVATAKEYRNRGICSALMERTHGHLSEKGYTGALLVPGSPELFGFYEKLGYKTATYVREFSVDYQKSNLGVKKIEKNEYAELRRCYLPEGAVLQDEENLDFLKAQASFYTGDGFLLAARREGDTLFGVELLGEVDRAAQIVGAFGLERGKFRTPGREKQFSMYKSLKKSKTPPTYFGLAFD